MTDLVTALRDFLFEHRGHALVFDEDQLMGVSDTRWCRCCDREEINYGEGWQRRGTE